MSKLIGVNVINDSTISYNGVQYAKTAFAPAAGDIIRMKRHYRFLPLNAFYEVIAHDGGLWGDLAVIDEDGEPLSAPTDNKPGEDTNRDVYKRVVTVSDDNTVTVDGVQYRKVTRTALVGDSVLANVDEEDLRKGAVYTVTYVDEDNDVAVTDDGADDHWLIGGEFTVLERIADDTVTHQGVTYRKVTRKAVKGELVVVTKTAADYSRHFELGDIGVVTGDVGWEQSDIHVDFTNGKSKYIGPSASNSEYAVLERITDTQPTTTSPTQYREVKRPATVGERIKIVAKYMTYGYYDDGDELTVVRVDTDGSNDVRVDIGSDRRLILYREYVVLEPITTSQPSEPYEPQPGDKVRSKSSGKVWTLGKRAPQLDVRFGKAFYIVEKDGTWLGASQFDVIERATPLPVDPIAAKWAAIGRKVGEFREGDIVRVNSGANSGHPTGTIGKLVSGAYLPFPRKFGVKVNGVTLDHEVTGYTLVAPVESVFNA